jgi:hypothetical protein
VPPTSRARTTGNGVGGGRSAYRLGVDGGVGTT